MAKTQKKKVAASNKSAAAKSPVKPAAKSKAVKVASKAPVAKGKPSKPSKPVKVEPKAPAKKAVPVKAAPKAPVKVAAKEVKKASVPVKPAVVAKTSEVKKEAPKAEPAKVAKKEGAQKASSKAANKKAKKKEESEMDDDFLDADDLGSSEIDEYAEELEVVESYTEGDEDDHVWDEGDKDRDPEEIALTDAEGRKFCRHKDCDQLSVVESYCRYHYLLLWKKIQNRKKILVDGKLERYVEELTARYPDKFLEMIRRDLRTEKDFLSAIHELELDDSTESDFEEESENFIDEVRGMGEGTGVDEEEY